MPSEALLSSQFDSPQDHSAVRLERIMSAVPTGVIVADDDAVVRDFLRAVLTRAGHEVFVARDGAEAIQLAHDFPACLTILDIHMPRLDGLTACRMIRGLSGYRTRPILMLTVDNEPETRNMAERSGADQVLTKPFQIDALLRVLAAYISIPETLHDAPTAEAAVRRIARTATKEASTVPGFGKLRPSHPSWPRFSDPIDTARRGKHDDRKLN